MPNLLISLELQGYKTFATKTDFRFPAPLTAVVGPNGSGKSNIADSIRWVLGEQAYSLLRGKKTIDMIFSGSEQRSRASMASVSITFDNSTGWLPIDFNEVNVTRRAYRNGENEYLINNQKVRLKEINELLASSGLAERNYTIIGQGLVDSALSLKPEDRRSFFEEAAGIGLYRSRRSEANQKLEKTLHNVERIRDILAELKPRIRSLEKQQEKSISYNQIDDDLKLLLKDWYGYHWHRTQENLREAIKVNAAQQEKVNEARVEQQKLEAQLELLQRTLGQKRSRLSALHHSLSALHVEKEENSRQIAVLEEREKAQKNRLAEIQRNSDIDQDRHTALKGEIDELSQQRENNQQEFTSMDSDLKEAQSRLDQRLARRTEIEAQAYEHENAVNQSTQEILRLHALTEGLQKQNTLRDVDMLELHDLIQKNEAIFTEQQARMAELEKTLSGIAADILEKSEEKKTIDSASAELTEVREEQRNNVQKCAILLRKLQGQQKLLEEAEQSLLGFSSGAKTVIDAVRNGSLRGDYQLLLDLLDVPQKYEVAIASALGVVVEGIIIPSVDQINPLIEFISRNESPRTILIEKRDSQSPDLNAFTFGTLVRAAEVIPDGHKDQQVIKNLLSTVFIAEDISTAHNASQKLPPGCRIVTLNGEVFSADGTITVGKETRTKTFERKREKAGVEGEIISTQDTLHDMEEKLESLETAIKNKESQSDLLRQNIQQAESQHTQSSLELHKLQIEQEQRHNQLENDQKRLAGFASTLEKEKKDIIELEIKIADLEGSTAEKKNTSKTLYQQLQELPAEELRGAVMDMHSKLAVARQMVETNVNRLSEKQALLETYQNNIDAALERIQEIKQSLNEITQQLETIGSQDLILSKQLADLTSETQPLENQVEKEITDQSTFLEEVDAARQRFAIAERHKMQAQLTVEKFREKLERYQQQIGEDFGIFIAEEESPYGPKPLPIAGIVSQLPLIENLPESISDQINLKKSLLRRLGPVNPNAEMEFQEISERYKFLSDQLQDLDKAEQDLRKIVNELDTLMEKEFLKTFRKVAVEFENIFTQLFNGGSARLVIEDEEHILDSGIDIEATLPGRRKQELALLSGGERSLTAVALIFALLKISPTPFCILDEIDAMLDESNVMRVGELLKELSDTTQFIMITHNRNTVQIADIIYGVTMGKDSVSQVISLKLDELTEEMIH